MSALISHRDAWTLAFGPAPAAASETVVLVPPGAPIAAGFAVCRAALERGETARLVAMGATLAQHRPDWVAAARAPLFLSELDGYTPREKGATLAALEPGLRAWLDTLLDGVVPGAASEVFFSAAMARFFARTGEAWLSARGLWELHAGDRVICTVADSTLARLLAARREQRSRVEGRGSRVAEKILPRAALAALPIALAAGIRRAWRFTREARSRARLRELRAAESASAPQPSTLDPRPSTSSPRLWLSLIGHWPRMSRPVTDMLPPILRAAGERAGVLLQASLDAGAQHGIAEKFDRAPIFPTLDVPELAGCVSAVDQGVSAESARELGPLLLRSLACTARAAFRARRARLVLDDGEARCEILPEPGALARLISVDVLRAREAWEAAERLTRRRDFSRAKVIWPHCNGVADAATDLALRRAGATTVELMHGLSEVGYALRTGHTATTIKVLWTVPEAEDMAPFRPGQRCVGGYFPRPRPAPVARGPLAANEPVAILVASSYLVSAYGDDPTLYEPYQEPLLAAAVEAARAAGREVRLRWRPHPGDDPARLEILRRAWPTLERSTGTLDEDLRWARVLLSSMSSVVFEALFYDLPVFVHDIPRWDDLSMRVFDPRRLFGREYRLADLLAPCLKSGLSIAPEIALRRRLFGGLEPRSLVEVVGAGEPRALRGLA